MTRLNGDCSIEIVGDTERQVITTKQGLLVVRMGLRPCRKACDMCSPCSRVEGFRV